ncbi:MAG TPA: transketolase [Bacillota bacterium]|nr:transketolase [Bacillota bacterium]
MGTTEQLSINTIRTLAIDAIEKAQSGHPGLPMGAAPMAYTLWTEFMNHHPQNATWFNRDRFILSAGHGSMLLYALLHLSGYDVTIDDLKQFRQWGSNTPGHPEVLDTDGVEATTGPLGQGIAMAVGMAMAEAHLAATYNQDQFPIIDHYTYALISDGDIMEGISHEAASLAGHLGLGKLIALYDSNDISLDGDLNKAFSEQTKQRFEAYGWQVIFVKDGNDVDEIRQALKTAKENKDQPTLIEVKTVIGYGSPNKSGTSASHGAPLGEEEALLTKDYYKWTHDAFNVPDEVYADFNDKIAQRGKQLETDWNNLLTNYKKEYPQLAKSLQLAIDGQLPENWEAQLPVYDETTNEATRATSNSVLNAIAKSVPYFFGGSADLASSNNTMIKDGGDFSRTNYKGRNIWFGVREFAMGAALNGMALHGGLKVYGGTFFVFSDYLRPAIRLAALMKTPVTYVFTHDSIAVGEDGPTHEPIEQLASLRAMPGLSLIRPADANETQAAWRLAMESTDQPTALVLTRQNVQTLPATKEKAYDGVKKGAYIISPATKTEPDALLLATGSEVNLAVEAQKSLLEQGIDTQVVSMPSWDRFDEQSANYKQTIIPDQVTKRLAIEMGASHGWHKYVGHEGKVLTIDTFGASAPGNIVVEKYGFTKENVVNIVQTMLNE